METTNIIVYIFCYVAFFAFGWMCKIKGNHRLVDDDGKFTSKPKQLIGAHFFGIFCLGIIPVIFLKQSVGNVLISNKMMDGFSLSLYVLILMLLLTIAFRQSKWTYESKPKSINSLHHLSSNFFVTYFIVRATFLFSYELWFRGFFLFDCINSIGIPLAVFANVFLYVLVHIFNSKKEILACIHFGIVTCLLSILFNSAWPAIILHISFSFVYEYTFYRFNLNNSKIIKS